MDTYIDTAIPYVDAKAAQALAKGGAIVYCVLEASGVTDGWILAHIVPNMRAHGIQRQVCVVLGRALLWRLFDSSRDSATAIPEHKRRYMMQAYTDLGDRNTLAPGTNPVVVSTVLCVSTTDDY